MTISEELLNPDQAAKFLGLSVATLETWRAQGVGPRFVALSRKSIRYPVGAILEFVKQREVIPAKNAPRPVTPNRGAPSISRPLNRAKDGGAQCLK